jgi:addiction module HigA family antidote
MSNELRPFKNVGVGEFLEEELNARQMSVSDLSDRTNLSAETISSILANKQRITVEIANTLAAALELSPEFWMNMDARFISRQSHECRPLNNE